jgi:hypothetical protein
MRAKVLGSPDSVVPLPRSAAWGEKLWQRGRYVERWLYPLRAIHGQSAIRGVYCDRPASAYLLDPWNTVHQAMAAANQPPLLQS